MKFKPHGRITRERFSFSSFILHPSSLLLFSLLFLLSSCNDEKGKYTTGKDDPALRVTPKDIAQVEHVLAQQEAADRAKGLRAEAPPLTEEQLKAAAPHNPHSFDSAASSAPDKTGGAFDLKIIHGALPPGWEAEPPATSMRLAQARIPRAAGDHEDGELSVTFFGAEQGGGVEENLNRWYGQFVQPDGRPSREAGRMEEFTASGMKVTFLNLGGTMKASTMPGATGPQTPKENWRMLGAIVSTSEGPMFFKATGADKTMQEAAPKMKAFLAALAPGGAPAAPSPAVAVAPSQPMPAAPSAPAVQPPPSNLAAGAAVDLGPLQGTLPEGWQSRPPSSSMRAAEIAIPKLPGDAEDGELVVFFFGAGQGGSIEDNLRRWYGQFTQPDGRASEKVATTEQLMAGDLRAVMVNLPGTMEPSNMPGRPSPRHENWRMLGAIVMSPQGAVFFKATGPDKTMAANADKMRQFVKSVKAK